MHGGGGGGGGHDDDESLLHWSLNSYRGEILWVGGGRRREG